jgi:hypothetical protein
MTTAENLWADAEVISTYSREQAIEDGTLVDLCQDELGRLVKEAGFKFSVACTSAVFFSCIGMTEAAERAGNDMHGRLWDILWMLKIAIRRGGNGDRISFQVLVVRDVETPTLTELLAVCGPGDDASPVITIMFPEEE